jgi:pimeloyl-ACP methyl ester carboxylesterase
LDKGAVRGVAVAPDTNSGEHLGASDKIENGIYYSVTGSGEKTLVLLRGLARWSRHWLDFDKRLVDQGFRVIVIDNRGFGRSDAAPTTKMLSLYDLADDVAQIISRESPSGAHVVGLSLGAMIGLVLAATKPQLIRSLIMVNSSVGSSGLPRLSKRALLVIIGVLLTGQRTYGALAKLLLSPSASKEKREKFAAAWAAIDANAKVSVQQLWRQLKAARAFTGTVEMAAVQCPVVVVRCDDDQFVDPRNSDFIHKLMTHSKLLVHPSAGHELAVDDPDWFVKTIKDVVGKSSALEN